MSCFLSLLIAICLFLAQTSYADIGMYAECVKSYEFTDNPMDAIVLTPLNHTCQKRCEKECKAFSRTVQYDPEDPSEIPTELNASIITECQAQCQSGILFSSSYTEGTGRIKKTDPISTTVKGPVAIGVSCTNTREELKQNAARTKFTVKNGDKLKITLAGTSENSNKIYLCGKKTVELNPIFPNIHDKSFNILLSDWDNDKAQTVWKEKNDHRCFSAMSDADFAALKNKDIWSTKTGNTTCDWHARNPNYIDTGIYIADGDELSIAWSGEYAHTILNIPSGPVIANRQILIDTMRNTHATATEKNLATQIFSKSSTLLIRDPTDNSLDFSVFAPLYLSGEAARAADVPIGVVKYSEHNAQYKALNLIGSVRDEGLVTQIIAGLSHCNANKQSSYEDPTCLKVTAHGQSKYAYAGILKDFSTDRALLAIRHFEEPFSGSDSSKYIEKYGKTHFGGHQVDIQWGGCPFANGSRVQFAVIAEDNPDETSTYTNIPQINESKWHDLPPSALKDDGLLEISNAPIEGKLFLRIKSLQPPSSSASNEIFELYDNPANYHGQYYIMAQKTNNSDLMVKNGPISQIIKAVTDVLLGKDRKPGEIKNGSAIQKVFSGITNNKKFIALIRIMLVLYMVFTGIGFLLGTLKMKREEFIIRLIKFGFIATLISPTSWEFFGGYLVPMCVDGTTEIIAHIISGSYPLELSGLKAQDLMRDPYLIFETFDGPLKILLSSAVWKKVLAVLLNGLFGILIALMIVIAVFIYLVVMLKVIVLYLMAIIIISFLIIIAPITIPLMLFSLTKQIFDNWVKNLISFCLQPIFAFTSVALFNLLMIMLIKMTLGFTACPSCFLYIDLGVIYQACWIPSFYPLFNTHIPEVAGSSISSIYGILSCALAFVILAHCSYIFVSYITLIASTIATGTPIRNATIGATGDKAQQTLTKYAKFATSKASALLNIKTNQKEDDDQQGGGQEDGDQDESKKQSKPTQAREGGAKD